MRQAQGSRSRFEQLFPLGPCRRQELCRRRLEEGPQAPDEQPGPSSPDQHSPSLASRPGAPPGSPLVGGGLVLVPECLLLWRPHGQQPPQALPRRTLTPPGARNTPLSHDPREVSGGGHWRGLRVTAQPRHWSPVGIPGPGPIPGYWSSLGSQAQVTTSLRSPRHPSVQAGPGTGWEPPVPTLLGGGAPLSWLHSLWLRNGRMSPKGSPQAPRGPTFSPVHRLVGPHPSFAWLSAAPCLSPPKPA